MSHWWQTWSERIAVVLAEAWMRSRAEVGGTAGDDRPRPPPPDHPAGSGDSDRPTGTDAVPPH